MATYTQQQYDKLMEAIAQGVLEVKYANRSVTYRSLEDMLAIKDLMEQDLGIGAYASNKQGRRRVGVYHRP